jgi:hypothetical protein
MTIVARRPPQFAGDNKKIWFKGFTGSRFRRFKRFRRFRGFRNVQVQVQVQGGSIENS